MLDPFLALGDVLWIVDAVLQSSSSDELDDWMVSAIVASMSVAVGAVAVKHGFDRHRRSWLVDDTPTERVRSIAAGRTELKGVARPFGRTYDQPFTDGDCLYAKWRVKELVTRVNDEGEHEQTWETIATGTVGEHVVLEDDTGSIALESPPVSFSKDAETEKKRKGRENIFKRLWRWITSNPRPEPPYAPFLRENGVSVNTSNDRRYEQHVLEDGTDLYVLGQATPRDSASDLGSTDDALANEADVLAELSADDDEFRDDLVMERDSASEEYLVTDRSESTLVWRNRLLMLGLLAVGVVLVTVGAVFSWLSLQQYGII